MRTVLFLAFEGVQTLDLTGPAEVFAAANREARSPQASWPPLGRDAPARSRSGAGQALYALDFRSPAGGVVTTSCGLGVTTRALAGARLGEDVTVLVPGGEATALRPVLGDRAVATFLRRSAARAARTGSVCTGAFVLAASGVLDGQVAATHWSAAERLAQFRPAVRVDREALFVQRGRLWTSAGVTAGIDMALAMLEADHGRRLASAVASRLVLHVRRQGFQSQFSAALVAQRDAADPLAEAVAWARDHLPGLDVPALARRAALSPRTLHRRCQALLGCTPRQLIERLRVEHARALASPLVSQKELARRAGFGSPARMRRAFERVLGLTPRSYALLFAASGGR